LEAYYWPTVFVCDERLAKLRQLGQMPINALAADASLFGRLSDAHPAAAPALDGLIAIAKRSCDRRRSKALRSTEAKKAELNRVASATAPWRWSRSLRSSD